MKAPEPYRPLTIFLLTLLTAITGSAMPVVIKVAVSTIPPILFSALRLCIASMVLLPFLFRYAPGKKAHSHYLLLLLAVIGNTGNIAFFSIAISSITPTVTQILYLMAPIVVCVGSFFWLREPVSKVNLCGMAVGLAGAAVAISGGIRTGGSLGGTMIMLTAVCAHSMYLLASRPLRGEFHPLYLTALTFIVGSVVLGIIHLVVEPQSTINLSPKVWLGLLYTGVVGSALGYVLLQVIVQRGSAVAASALLYLSPPLTWGWSSAVFGEPFTVRLAVGGILSMIGAYLALSKRRIEVADPVSS